MPFYNWNTRNPLLPCADIRDANGQEIHGVLQCCTETGRLVRLRYDADGRCEQDENGDQVELMETRPAPLLVKFHEDGWKRGTNETRELAIRNGMKPPDGWHEGWPEEITCR
jgi:hypothetical protein